MNMRHPLSQFALLAFLVLAAGLFPGTAPLLAGGPFLICDETTGTAFAYPAAPVPIRIDPGSMGPNLTNAQADLLTENGYAQWTNVATASFAHAAGPDIPFDVDATNAFYMFGVNGYGIDVIYDADGSIFSDFFGAPPGVLGLAGPKFIDFDTCELSESFVVLNGAGVDPADVGGVNFGGVFTHEFGHSINLAHSQTNGAILFFGDDIAPSGCEAPYDGTPALDQIETMYPFIDPSAAAGLGQEMAIVDNLDDIASVSNIYPDAGWPGSAATISGTILAADASSEIRGVNVVARNLADPFGDAISALSGDFSLFFGVPPDGSYTFNGLTPGAEYAVYIDAIVAGGFSIFPAGLLPEMEEFWNDDAEGSDPDLDDRCAQVAAVPTQTADIIINDFASTDPNESNDDSESATPAACGFTSTDTEIFSFLDVDYYRFTLTAGQTVDIDVDSAELGTSLDSVLGLFDAGLNLLTVNDDDPGPGEFFSLDSHIEKVLGPGLYYFAVAAFADFDFDGSDGTSIGGYTVSLTCGPIPPVAGNDLLGSTGGKWASLINVHPGFGEASFRAPQGAFGPANEIEFRDDGVLFGTTGGGSSNLVRIDPSTGVETLVGRHTLGAIDGLEFVDGTLYGTYVAGPGLPSDLVIVDTTTAALTTVGPTGFASIGGLAFDPSSGTLYGATAGAGGGDLVTIDLGTGAATLVGSTGFTDVSALELSPIGTLYGGLGIDDIDAGSVVLIDPTDGAGSFLGPTGFPAVTGLSFVPGPLPVDGGFELGSPNPFWSEFSTNFGTPLCFPGCGARSGDVVAFFGGTPFFEEGALSQTFVLPASRGGLVTRLNFYLNVPECSGSPDDYLEVLVNGEQLFVIRGDDPSCGGFDYTRYALDISSFLGSEVTLEFHSVVEGLGLTSFFLDDVEIALLPTAIFADGFESGDTSAWSSTVP